MSKRTATAANTTVQTPATIGHVVVQTSKTTSVEVPSAMYDAMSKLGFGALAIAKAWQVEEGRQAKAALDALPSVALAADEAAIAAEERKASREESEGYQLASVRRGVARARVSLRVDREMRLERQEASLADLEERASLVAKLSPERQTAIQAAQATLNGLKKQTEATTVAQSGTIVPSTTASVQ